MRRPDPYGVVSGRPPVAAVLGAVAIAFSGPLVRLASVEPTTAAVFRCAYAVPVLWVLARREDARFGPRPRRDRGIALVAGVLFAADLVFWHRSIAAVGAGLATVLANLQVVAVAILAWVLLGEHPSRRLLAALPVAVAGVALISGVLEEGAYGDRPLAGVVYGVLTALSYAVFLLVHRRGSRDLRRPAGPLLDATASAAVTAILAGVVLGDVDLVPTWPEHGWLLLLAIESQVLGWLLISISLPRLPAALTSVLLLVQPVGAVALGVVLLGESPSVLQLGGVVLVLAGVLAATAGRRRAAMEPAPEGAVVEPGGPN